MKEKITENNVSQFETDRETLGLIFCESNIFGTHCHISVSMSFIVDGEEFNFQNGEMMQADNSLASNYIELSGDNNNHLLDDDYKILPEYVETVDIIEQYVNKEFEKLYGDKISKVEREYSDIIRMDFESFLSLRDRAECLELSIRKIETEIGDLPYHDNKIFCFKEKLIELKEESITDDEG